MWKLESAEIYHNSVNVTYTRENPTELYSDLMFIYVEGDKVEVHIVFYDKDERYKMSHWIDRRIIHKCDKELQALWNETYRHGKFD